jgi:plastocyanin
MYRVEGTFGKSSGRQEAVKIFSFALVLLAGGLLLDGSPVARSHTIRLTGDHDKSEYRFSPARLTVNRGDTLVFQVESGGPHALGLDSAGLSPGVREAWNQALPRRRGLLRGPMIRADHPYFVVIPPGVRPGKYTIFCLPHRAYDMKLELEVK